MVCSACNGKLERVLDLGEMALAGAFLKPEMFHVEHKYPLHFCFCPSCYLVQVEEKIPPDILFRDYFYCTSAIGTMREHFSDLARRIHRFAPKKVVEIGCNDGALLNRLKEEGVPEVIGIDPANVAKGVANYNEFLSVDIAREIGSADVVVACNVFAHIEDINTALEAVCEMLSGVFIIEVNYLGDLIDKLQYDWIYHEHLYYFSLMSMEKLLKRHGLSVFDVERIKSHAGSVRFYISRFNTKSPAVKAMREEESIKGFPDFLFRFANDVKIHREEMQHISALTNKAGYGACGRSNTMIQYCDLKLDYMIDDAPAKTGYFTPGSHIEIFNRSKLKEQPEYLVIFAWSFLAEIERKLTDYNGTLIIPLPKLHFRTV